MVITVGPELEAAVKAQAQRQGIAPDVLILDLLRERFLSAALLQPRDEWERRLLGLGRDCGVSFTDEALGRESLYE